MDILGRINSGQIDITVDVWHSAEYNKDPISKTEAREKVMQLIKLGAEAEKANLKCEKINGKCECYSCLHYEVCKMVRESEI